MHKKHAQNGLDVYFKYFKSAETIIWFLEQLREKTIPLRTSNDLQNVSRLVCLLIDHFHKNPPRQNVCPDFINFKYYLDII